VTGSAPRAVPANESVVDLAMSILSARRGCPPDEAFTLLIDAAAGYDMDVSDLAGCLVAEQELRKQPDG
jgi:AmiR/NasT family two-component response regulator